MNPLVRAHINAYLQTHCNRDIDHAASVLVPTSAQSLGYSGSHLHGIRIADDVAGGWTSTADIEMNRRFALHANRTWCSTVLLASEPPTYASVIAEITAAIVRHHWQTQHGTPVRLREMLAQEHRFRALCRNTPKKMQKKMNTPHSAALRIGRNSIPRHRCNVARGRWSKHP